MKETYSVRAKHDLFNSLQLNLQGCGMLYMEPNKDYFFENAPIEFIDYLGKMSDMNITYRITKDKRGCYRTIDLSCYNKTNPLFAMQNFRGAFTNVSNKVEDEQPIEEPPKTEPPVVDLEKNKDDSNIPNLFEGDSTPNKVEEITVSDIPVIEGQMSIDDITDEGVQLPEGDPNDSVTGTDPEENAAESKVEIVDPETITAKAELIEYAHKLGLDKISDINTKKEIRKAIKDFQEQNK